MATCQPQHQQSCTFQIQIGELATPVGVRNYFALDVVWPFKPKQGWHAGFFLLQLCLQHHVLTRPLHQQSQATRPLIPFIALVPLLNRVVVCSSQKFLVARSGCDVNTPMSAVPAVLYCMARGVSCRWGCIRRHGEA